MAGISKRPGGRKWIRFRDAAGYNYTLRLGKCDMRTATMVRSHVEAIQAALVANCEPPPATQEWLVGIEDTLHDRMVRVYLVAPRDQAGRQTITVSQLVADYIESRRADLKPNSILKLRNCQRNLDEFFVPTKRVMHVTVAEARDFVRWLKSRKDYQPATISKRTKVAKQFFAYAIDRGIIKQNPFRKEKAASQANRDRDFFVSREIITDVLEACPDAQWRAIVALCRYGGLRCPSEVVDLKWESVDWGAGHVLIEEHKTNRRKIPLFPELRPHLAEAFEQAAEGARYVASRYRNTDANLRTPFDKIVHRSGHPIWPKPFQNMRASRETELLREHPIHIAAEWIGHSPKVALKHYAQVIEQDRQNAAFGSASDVPEIKSEHTQKGGVAGNRT